MPAMEAWPYLAMAAMALYRILAESMPGHTRISAWPATASAPGRSGMPLTDTESGEVARSKDSGPHTTQSVHRRLASSRPIQVDPRDGTCFSLAERMATLGRFRPMTVRATSTALLIMSIIRPKLHTVVTPASVRIMGRPPDISSASKIEARVTVGRSARASM